MAIVTRRQILQHLGKGIGATCMMAARPTSLSAQEQQLLTLGTAGKGGVFYPLGSGLAAVISKYAKGMAVDALVTSGAAENMALLQAGKIPLALAQADVCWAAAQGQLDGLPEKIQVRALLGTTSGYMHLVTLEGLGIDTVADLKGKRVSTGLIGSGTEIKALRVLEAYGVTPGNLGMHVHQEYPEAAQALKEGKLDAFAWDATLPGKSVMDLAMTPGIRIRLLATGDAVPHLVAKYGPFYFSASIPKTTYPGMHEDVSVVAGKTLLVTHQRMPSSQAYAITKALLEHRTELTAIVPATKEMTPKSVVLGCSVPFHAGALGYYKENNIAVPT